MGVDGFALRVGQTLFKTYGNLGQMMVYFCGFTLLYYRYKGQKVLDRIAPVGRMSVTNYMAQSIVGVSLFYGFGGNFAVEFNYLQSFLLGAAFCVIRLLIAIGGLRDSTMVRWSGCGVRLLVSGGAVVKA